MVLQALHGEARRRELHRHLPALDLHELGRGAQEEPERDHHRPLARRGVPPEQDRRVEDQPDGAVGEGQRPEQDHAYQDVGDGAWQLAAEEVRQVLE